jgi:hypothetical protein
MNQCAGPDVQKAMLGMLKTDPKGRRDIASEPAATGREHRERRPLQGVMLKGVVAF